MKHTTEASPWTTEALATPREDFRRVAEMALGGLAVAAWTSFERAAQSAALAAERRDLRADRALGPVLGAAALAHHPPGAWPVLSTAEHHAQETTSLRTHHRPCG